MAMNRDQKSVVIDSLKNEFASSQASFVVGYKGLTVKQLEALRRELRTSKSKFRVAKARLIKRAVGDVEGVNELAPYFKEQIGVVFVTDEATSAVAKVLYNFSQKNEALKLIVGYSQARLMPQSLIERIATLPSREVLLAQVCYLLGMQMQRLMWTLQKIAEKKQS